MKKLRYFSLSRAYVAILAQGVTVTILAHRVTVAILAQGVTIAILANQTPSDDEPDTKIFVNHSHIVHSTALAANKNNKFIYYFY